MIADTRKNGQARSETLAELLRGDLLPIAYVPPKELQEPRRLTESSWNNFEPGLRSG
jgi:hypothetical protein